MPILSGLRRKRKDNHRLNFKSLNLPPVTIHFTIPAEIMKRLDTLFHDTESLIIFGSIIILTILASALIDRGLMNKLVSRSKAAGNDITSIVFIKNIIRLTIYLFGIGWAFLSLPITKSFAHSLFAGAGVTTLIMGFSAQQILSNLMSGMFLILNRPFRIHDTIEVQAFRGKVVRITWHDTVIENEEKSRIFVPNSVITSNIIKVISVK